MTAPMATQPTYRAHWDRGDGYDARDPNAPFVPSCSGCDALIFDGVCADCSVTLAEEARHASFDGEIVSPAVAGELRSLGGLRQPAVIASATEPASRLRPAGFRQAQDRAA